MKNFSSVLFFTILAVSVSAAIININADGTGDYPTIQAAIDAANPNDEIVLADGIYTGAGNRDIDPNGKNVTIRSQNGAENCVIDCGGSETEHHHGFYFHNGEDNNFVIDGLTIINGYAADGGAILCNQSNPLIRNCVFINNTADSITYGGGAICNISSTPMIFNCTFVNNKTYKGCGGAVCNYENTGDSFIISSTFTQNIATGHEGSYGGGIFSHHNSGSLTIQDCTFTNNSAVDPNSEGCGGAISTVSGNIKVLNCDFIENRSDMYGAAIWCIADSNGPIVSGCKFISNISDGGAGLCTLDCNPLVKNCSFIGNSATGRKIYSGGGILNWGGDFSQIRNCTLTGNKAYYKDYIIYDQDTPYEHIRARFIEQLGIGSAICNYMNNSNISNCIFSNNNHPDGNEVALLGLGTSYLAYNNLEYSSINTCSAHTSVWGAGNINVDPCFVDAGYWDPNNISYDPNTGRPTSPMYVYRSPFYRFTAHYVWIPGDYHLTEQSLCINAGDPNYIPSPNETDLDGLNRIYGGRIDMGAYEFPINNPPVAVAGPDQTFYACFDSFIDFILDGSGSYDEDGDELDYFWSWLIDSNLYEANGVNPTITLPVGSHQIELIVDDGWGESEPDYCTINVIAPLKVNMMCSPKLIYPKSFDRYIMAVITMPKGINPSDINRREPLLFLPGNVTSSKPFVWQAGIGQFRRTYVIASFNKTECMKYLKTGSNKVNVAGRFNSGQYFYGTDYIQIMNFNPWSFWKFVVMPKF